MVWNKEINKRGKFGLKSKNTGKIIEKFRTLGAAVNMKSKYQKQYYEDMRVVEL